MNTEESLHFCCSKLLLKSVHAPVAVCECVGWRGISRVWVADVLRGSGCCDELTLAPIKTTAHDRHRIQNEELCGSGLYPIHFSLVSLRHLQDQAWNRAHSFSEVWQTTTKDSNKVRNKCENTTKKTSLKCEETGHEIVQLRIKIWICAEAVVLIYKCMYLLPPVCSFVHLHSACLLLFFCVPVSSAHVLSLCC